jgi:tetratricopeptide (TPR) repeat protein
VVIMPTPCPDPLTLERFLLGQLSDHESEPVELHLLQCASCWATARTLDCPDTFVEAMQDARVPRAEESEIPVVQALMARLDGQWRQALGAPAPESAPAADDWLAPPQEAGEIGRLGPYPILKVLGTGGMGVVYLARQMRPRRLIALKVIRAGSWAEAERLARFRAEAEVAARLRHPNIVPVYEAGEHQGRPYFTMEHVDGGSLAQKLAADPLASRAAAGLVETLARAMEAAHERGFVHRDLKPSNVLLAADGTPKITDFGLAKQLAEEPGEPLAAGRTESGVILGTPSYMAPEQAGGQGQQVGPAADVYALGAILYESLTGRPPFRAAGVLETLEQVRSQEPVPPGRLQPGVPRDLQTVCLKCLEKDPARRYGSAQAMADDLGRFLRGEPIRARPASPAEQLGKWVRRRPALAGLMGVSVLSLVLFVTAVLSYSARLRGQVERAETAEGEARRQQRRAEGNYRQARETVNRMLSRLTDQRLAQVPRLAELRKTLSEDALQFFNGIARGIDDPDPAVRLDVAQAHMAAGKIQFSLNRGPEARANYERAVALLEPLLAAAPQHRNYRERLLECYITLGNIDRGRFDALSLASDLKALAFCQESARRFPDDPRWRGRLATVYNNLGQHYVHLGQLDDAERYMVKALALREELARREPHSDQHQESMAITANNLGEVHKGRGRFREAEAAYRKAAAVFEQLVARSPDDHFLAQKLATVANNRAGLLLEAGRLQAAVELLTPVIQRLEPFARREPRHQANLGLVHSLAVRTEAYQRLGAAARARQDWQRLAEVAGAFGCEEWRAWALAHLGQWRQALTFADAAGPPGTLFARARVLAVCAQAAAADPKLSAAEQASRSRQYSGRAWELLQAARAAGTLGFADAALELRHSMDFSILRSRPDFYTLLGKPGTGPADK